MNWMVVVYVGCEILVAIGAIFGNTLVITAFRRERRLRRRTNYYIVSLAVADLLVGLLGIPCALLAYSGYPKQLHACLFTVSLLVVLCTISIFSLVAVSVDRYWAILYPMGYSRNVRTKTAVGIICFCWVAGAIVGFLPLLGWNAGQSGQELEECRFTKVMNYNFLVFIYFATIIFPGLLMAAFYAHIYSVVVKQLKQMVTVNGTSGGSGAMLRVLGAARKREVKATQNLSIIVLFFMVCWFPLYTINFIQAYHKDISIPTFLMDSCIILTHLNSAGNPLLYAYHLRDFRAALRAVLFGGATQETDRRVIGRDNSAYLHDLEQRRRSSQLNLYAKAINKDQNLNLTHLPVIHNKLSDIQESSRNESSIKVVIPTENNEISKTTSFFKFPLDRSLSLLKASDKEKTTQRMSNFGSEKQDFTYNHLEESNASLANDGSTGRVEGREGVLVNGGVVNNGFLRRDEGKGVGEGGKDGKLENTAETAECNNDKDESLSTKVTNEDEKQDCNGNLDGSYSRESGLNTEGTNKEGKKGEESCDDADYGDDETDEDEDTNVKTGNEITTGIFNDCFVEDDDEDSVDEIDNSILSNDRVSAAIVKNDDETCGGYRHLDDSNNISTKLQDIGGSDLRRLDSENDQVSISSRNLEKVDSEVGIPYRNLEKVDSDVDIPYCELKKVDSEISIPYRKIQKVDSDVDIPYCELKKPDTEVGTPLCNLKKFDSDFDTFDCTLERVDSEVDIPYNKLSSNDLEEVDKSYNDLNINKECEKVGFTFSNLQEDDDLKQMCGNLDRRDSEKSSQQGLKYKNSDEYDPKTLEDVNIPYCSLDQEDLGDVESKEKRHLKTKREDVQKREMENFPENIDISDTSISNEGASSKADTHSLKEVFKKNCMKQESITPSNSKTSTTSQTSDIVTDLENLKHGNT